MSHSLTPAWGGVLLADVVRNVRPPQMSSRGKGAKIFFEKAQEEFLEEIIMLQIRNPHKSSTSQAARVRETHSTVCGRPLRTTSVSTTLDSFAKAESKQEIQNTKYSLHHTPEPSNKMNHSRSPVCGGVLTPDVKRHASNHISQNPGTRVHG